MYVFQSLRKYHPFCLGGYNVLTAHTHCTGLGPGQGTGNGTGTIENNGFLSLSLSLCCVHIAQHNIETRHSWPRSLSLSRSGPVQCV